MTTMKRRHFLRAAATAGGAAFASNPVWAQQADTPATPKRGWPSRPGKVEILFKAPGLSGNGMQCTEEGIWTIDITGSRTDTPGRWDHWPSGFLFTGGADDGVDGKVVIAPGDIIFPFKTYVQTPIELVIEQGRIEHIDGQLDADLLREYMASFRDPDGYGIAHIGWGMLETAMWSILATDRRGMGMHGRSFYGNVLFSTGPNQELGGPNDTACHVDVPMRNCTLYLDDEPVVVKGDVVVDELKADAITGVAS